MIETNIILELNDAIFLWSYCEISPYGKKTRSRSNAVL